MAVPRVLLRGRCLFTRTAPCVRVTPSIASIRIPFPKRSFTSSISAREDVVATTSGGPEIALTDAREQANLEPVTPETPVNHAQTVALLKVPKRLGTGEIVELIKGAGCTVKKLQIHIHRFSFFNNTLVFAELGSEEEAKSLVEQWKEGTPTYKEIRIRPIKSDFGWAQPTENANRRFPNLKSRSIIAQGNEPRDALRPLEEGRRRLLSVQTPGWSPNTAFNEAREKNLDIIERVFFKYGVEAISPIAPFKGDLKSKPRMLCFIDFETKEGAEKASKEIDDTVVEGKLTWLRSTSPAAWRAYQYAKFAPEYVAELQEKGVLPKQAYQDKFLTPLPEKKKKRQNKAESSESQVEASENKASE